ncbi:serine hydrolase [Streptomyces violaceusniger]|uniref:Beta-lactamase n=1 Tax=Streptomyces violaceusniger (strain Tu 4113) TaxID=653045 RepID=G2NVM3_STRV4|nr:serine hydrolase [Streptomyces violaceusniger]AEM85907.1 beta-lactamase [Streptomyces violaceusniger Tu 4113]
MRTPPGLTDLDAVLERATLGHTVAGASVCLIDSTTNCASVGLKRVGTAAPVDPHTLFPLGSVTKIVVATVACQLVAEGKLALDAPVASLVPELHTLGARGAAITARMLLSHTSGLADAWDGSASLTELLGTSHGAAAPAAPGEGFSYSNTGYVVLGQLIEKLTGLSWMEAAQRAILRPAGISSAVFTAPGGAATGHVLGDDGALVPGDLWPPVGPLFGPAGATMHATAVDTARLVLACATGRTQDGRELLPEWMVDEMLRLHAPIPGAPLHFRGWGLGWALPVAGPSRSVEHIGGTSAFIHVEANRGVALAVLTNFPEGWAFGEEVLREALGYHRPALPTGPGPAYADRYVGEYASPAFGVTVRAARDGRLLITSPLTGRETDLHHQEDDSFWADFGALETEVSFMDFDHGRAGRLHTALRMLRRVS